MTEASGIISPEWFMNDGADDNSADAVDEWLS